MSVRQPVRMAYRMAIITIKLKVTQQVSTTGCQGEEKQQSGLCQ
jgi:hypothetical protein